MSINDDKNATVYLTTERLLLRQFTADDVDNLLELDGDPDVRRYLDMSKAPTRAQIAAQTLPRFLAFYARPGGFGYWAALEKSSGAFLGWFHLRPLAADEEAIELGYRLKRTAWGQGYATEGAKALIEKGFQELGVQRVTATALAANAASIRVMEKIGMTFQKRYWYKPGMEAVQYAREAPYLAERYVR